jgi:hypothetical protein
MHVVGFDVERLGVEDERERQPFGPRARRFDASPFSRL